jgi:hypothetical protein
VSISTRLLAVLLVFALPVIPATLLTADLDPSWSQWLAVYGCFVFILGAAVVLGNGIWP